MGITKLSNKTERTKLFLSPPTKMVFNEQGVYDKQSYFINKEIALQKARAWIKEKKDKPSFEVVAINKKEMTERFIVEIIYKESKIIDEFLKEKTE